MSRALIEYLESVVPAENILLEEPMHKHTTCLLYTSDAADD